MNRMNLAVLLGEYQERGPQVARIASRHFTELGAAASVESSGQALELPAEIRRQLRPMQKEAPKEPNFAELHTAAQSAVAELRLFYEKFSPVMKLYEKTKDVERLFLSIRPKEVARVPGLVFRRGQFEASWALAHYISDHEAFEADVGRVTEARLAELAKDFRSALADYRDPSRFSQDVLVRYRDAKKSILESIGPKDYPHDPGYDYVAALKARLQAEKQYESPIPFAMEPMPAAC